MSFGTPLGGPLGPPFGQQRKRVTTPRPEWNIADATWWDLRKLALVGLAAGPTGNLDAYELIPTDSDGAIRLQFPKRNNPVAIGQTYSVWLRASATTSNVMVGYGFGGLANPETITPTWQQFSMTIPNVDLHAVGGWSSWPLGLTIWVYRPTIGY